MAKALRSGLYPNESLLAVARLFVNENSIVVDIGAHIGTFAIPIAKEVEKVIAFEPSADAFPFLVQNAKENKVEVDAINKALGEQAGSGKIVVRNASNAGANILVKGGDIPVVTLDSEVERADFIKIDVEGMELEVLLGGVQLIERSRPVVLFEVNLSQLRAHGTSPRALQDFFNKHSYQLYIPLEQNSGILARVKNSTLMTALIAPRAWMFFSESAPFDLIAIPKERSQTIVAGSFFTACTYALINNLVVKIHRLQALLR